MYFYPYDDYDCNDVYYDELSAPSLGISGVIPPPPPPPKIPPTPPPKEYMEGPRDPASHIVRLPGMARRYGAEKLTQVAGRGWARTSPYRMKPGPVDPIWLTHPPAGAGRSVVWQRQPAGGWRMV